MGALRRIGALVRLHLLQIARDRGELFSSFVLPLLLTALLGAMYGQGSYQKPRVAVADLDGSAVSRIVLEGLRGQESLVVTETTRAHGEAAVADEEFAALVVVPEGFGESVRAGKAASLEVVEAPGATAALAVRQVVDGLAARLSADQMAADQAILQLRRAREAFEGSPPALPPPVRAQLIATIPYLEQDPSREELFDLADTYWTPSPVKLESKTLTASTVRGDSTHAAGHEQSSLGVTVWFILMMLLGSAVTLLEERENRTLPRLLSTPSSRAVIFLGKVAGLFVVGLLQAAVMIAFGALVFGVPWGSDPFSVALIVGAYTLAATGMAVALAAVVRTRSQASAAGPVLSVGLAMVGGTMWPISIMPEGMQTAARFTPTGQAMLALTDVVVRNRGLDAAVAPALALLAMAVVFFAIGVSRFKYE